MRKAKSKSDSDLVKCPFCHGRGKLPQSELLNHLHDKDLLRKVEGPAAPPASDVETLTPQKLDSKAPRRHRETELLNLTHFLWRRTPKD